MRCKLAGAVVLAALLVPALRAEETFNVRFKYNREFKPDNHSIVCARIAGAPKMDGTLNDPLWQQAGKTESAFTNFPSKDVCGRQTLTLLCCDENNIYVAFDCEEKELDQQQIDNKNVRAGDHVGVHFEVGSNGGRGPRCSIFANRGGCVFAGPWREQKAEVKCAAGPNRWYVQIAIPFKSLPCTAPMRGEEWGLKLTRYGKVTETGASRMRSAWPYIPMIVEDVTTYSASMFFDADSMLLNSALTSKDGAIPDWKIESGKPALADGKFSSAEESVLTQLVKLRRQCHFSLKWTGAEGLDGSVAVKADDKQLSSVSLSAKQTFFALDKTESAKIELHLKGNGPPPNFRLSRIFDDVPDEWVCLTNNDARTDRNLKSIQPQSKDGRYIYLKCPLYNWDFVPYHSLGCPNPGQEMSWEWGTIGRPTRKPLESPPPHPEIAEEEFESFPFETIYQDGQIPEFVGLPMGNHEKGGDQGWIPFSKGTLTGESSWVGWPINRWGSGTNNGQSQAANTHDILFDLPENFFIRRIDILKINNGSFPSIDVSVRSSTNPDETFVPICKYNAVTPYASLQNLDSVARQVRITVLGCAFENKFGHVNAYTDLLGISQIWIWGEPKGAHADTEVKAYRPPVPNQVPPLKCIQLQKLPEPIIWPLPKQITKADGRFELKAGATLVFAREGILPQIAANLQSELQRRFCTDVVLKDEAEFSGGDGCIYLGMKSVTKRFDELCAGEGMSIPAEEPQSYALKISPARIVIAGGDVSGVFHACQTLMQWMDHDEHVAFARSVSIRDWPLLRMRTVVPSADHRQPIFPFGLPESNYFKMMSGLARLRFNSIVDWQPDIPYQTEERTLELIQYAAERMIDVRPALYLRQVPGSCIEANPDDQPGGNGGIGGADGFWETANLCPSNPETFKAIEDYLAKTWRTHNNSPYVEVGYLGCLQGSWNVCRLCRRRQQSGEELYADFLNKVGSICRARGKTAVFTNAIMLSDAIQRAGDKRTADAYDTINRAVAMRIDRPVNSATLVQSGFWTLSRPWATPAPVASGGYNGGAPFFAGLPLEQPVEGAICSGERADYDNIWTYAFSSPCLLASGEFWSGPRPAPPKATPKELADTEQLVANVCVRFNEQIAKGFEYPSWRTGMTPQFFTLDLKDVCTRSHIDEGTASGLGHSGPREGLIASGPAYDFRRLPTGRQVFADVPFEIIDPAANKWKSIVVLGDIVKQQLIPGSKTKVEIPVGKKTASLCVLRCLLRKSNRLGDNRCWVHLTLPAYIYNYADGTRYVCDREMMRNTDAINCPQCFQEGNDKGAPQQTSNQIGGSLYSFLSPAYRVAYCTNALSGAGTSLFMNEFVNPYPEKEVKSLVVQLPNPEQRDWTFGFHEAIFAVTGVDVADWDVKFWGRLNNRGDQFPLLPANSDLAGLNDLFANCDYVQAGNRGSLVSKETKQPIAELWGVENSSPPTWRIQFKTQQTVAGMSFRLMMPWRDAGPMPLRFRHADCKISVSTDQKTWTEVAVVPGCTGMDGEHSVTFAPTAATAIQFTMDSSKYVDEIASQVGPLSLRVFTQGK